MVEQVVQGPLSGIKGRSEGSQTDVGTTGKLDSTQKAEGTPKPPEPVKGRAEPGKGTSDGKPAPDTSVAEESFLEKFDPTTLSEELQPAYQSLDKQFKAALTKKTQAIAKQKQKIEAYDAFEANPIETLKRIASQYGLNVEPIGKKSSETGQFDQNWQPQSWDEVFELFMSNLTPKLEQQFMGRLQPIFDSLQKVTSDNIEKQLGEIDKDWKIYEDEMTENMKLHPTLAKDVAKLYRISVPEDVLKSKYTQAALKKFEDKAASAKVQGKSSVQSSSPIQDKKMTFQESIEWAKRKLAE